VANDSEKNIDLQNPLGETKQKNKDKKGKKKKKGGFPVVAVIALLLIIGSIVALLFFNVFGFRENYVMPYLRNAPLIGPLFPAPPEGEEGGDAGKYANTSREELISMITALEYQVQTMEKNEAATRDQIAKLNETINYLRGFESQIEAYRQIKAEFDQMIALGDPEAYKNFFESISPENADRLYQEVLKHVQYDDEFKKYASAFAMMDAGEAATALTNLLTTNSTLLVKILWAINTESRAEIFNEMEPNNVSRIARLMEPEEPITEAPVVAPPLPALAPTTATAETAAEQ
jgi:flagellar motility protein MotE (MotC chaperone)